MGRLKSWGLFLGLFLAGSLVAQDFGVVFDTTSTGIQTPRTLRMQLYPGQCDSVCVQFIEFTYDTLPSLYFEGPFCATPPNVGTFFFDIGNYPFPDDAHVVYTIYHNGSDSTNVLNIDPVVPGQFYPFPETPCEDTGIEEGTQDLPEIHLQVLYRGGSAPRLRYVLPPTETRASLTIYDLLGRELLRVEHLSQQGEFSLKTLPRPGVLFVVIQTNKWSVTQKVWVGTTP